MEEDWLWDKVRLLAPAGVADMDRAGCEHAVGWLIMYIAIQSKRIERLEFAASYPHCAFTWDLDEHPQGWNMPCMCGECRSNGD